MSDAFLQSIWDWTWPCLVFAAWVVTAGWSLHKFFKIFAKLITEDTRVDEALISRLQKLAWSGLLVTGVYVWMWLTPMPETVRRIMRDDVQPWFWYTVALIAWVIAGVYFTRRIIVFLGERAKLTNTAIDDALAEAIRRPLYIVTFLFGLNLWAAFVPLAVERYTTLLSVNKGGTILVIVLFLEAFVSNWIRIREADSRVLATSGGVLTTAAKIVIYVLGFLIILSTIDIDITPLIASLGIGSLAIGLALQKTLEDFLAGLLIAADQPIRVGDFVEVGNEFAGFVLRIGWRTTRIRTRDDYYVIVPNAYLGQATVVNRSMPSREADFKLSVGIAYDSDLDAAKRLIEEVAESVQQNHEDAVHSASPRVLFEGFGESSIELCIWLRAHSWNAHYRLRDAFIRRLHPALHNAGIEIPFPIRTLRLDGVPAEQLTGQVRAVNDVGAASPDAQEAQTIPETRE